MDVRFSDAPSGRSRFTLKINGAQQSDIWQAPGDDRAWKTHMIRDVQINTGDIIAVEVEAGGGEFARLDYVQLNLKSSSGRASTSPVLLGKTILAPDKRDGCYLWSQA